MLGVPKNSVILYPHSEEWTILFQRERINLYSCIKEEVIDIEHVGSMSINGMCSKPIIDIVVGIKDFKDGFRLIDDIESIGYHFKGSLGKSNRFFFWKGNKSSNTYNLHIVEYGDQKWENQILFRNFMNNHSEYRDKYCSMKMELANKYKDDRDTYTKEKTKFIVDVIQLAKEELKKD